MLPNDVHMIHAIQFHNDSATTANHSPKIRSNSIPPSSSPSPSPQSLTCTSAQPPPRRRPENLSLALVTLDGPFPSPPPLPVLGEKFPPTEPTVDISTSVKESMPPPRARERPGCRSARFWTSLFFFAGGRGVFRFVERVCPGGACTSTEKQGEGQLKKCATGGNGDARSPTSQRLLQQHQQRYIASTEAVAGAAAIARGRQWEGLHRARRQTT